jgi:hypothetical protein
MVEKIKFYYENELWDINRVWNVVGRAITQEDYFEITGFVFPDKGVQ